MDLDQLENLWHIGISNKLQIAAKRKQIGKFGIGKLASYAVARRATYISRTKSGIHAVTIDFELFANATNKDGVASPVKLKLRRIAKLEELESSHAFQLAAAVLETKPTKRDLAAEQSWTLVVLEDLKEKAHRLSMGRLRWVLKTAMPLESNFSLYLNGEEISSSKDDYEKRVEFKVSELEDARLTDLGAVTGEKWQKTSLGLVSESFPSGVEGEVFVTNQSLYSQGGKSEDLGRSHGFFVRVHNRLINESDPLFGARPLSFTTFYRFAAIVEVSDLNKYVTASRDDIEQTEVKKKLRELLIQLFNQARDRYETMEREKEAEEKRKKEGTREYVSTELVERPLADALVAEAATTVSVDGEIEEPVLDSWRLVEPILDVNELRALVEQLYATERKHRRYTFKYSPAGSLMPLARLDARTATFVVNEDHELVREFAVKADSKRLLEAFIVGEALLEVYLRAADVESEIVSDLLQRRDSLLRSLAVDESYSLRSLAASLRSATASANELEVSLVGAMRALGFNATHISGSGEPDGLAHYLVHGIGEKSFTLEAKSSADVPSLPQLDFAGLRSHYLAKGADGCMLVAPAYPGADDPNSEVSLRARQQNVSCWTIDQVARMVESAERRHINAPSLQDIVLTTFSPLDVTAAAERLLSDPSFDKVDLYQAIIVALTELEVRLRDTPRNISMLAAEISRDQKFSGVKIQQIREAVNDLARASKGMLHLTASEEVHVLGTIDELRRRVADFSQESAPPRRRGTFRRILDDPQ